MPHRHSLPFGLQMAVVLALVMTSACGIVGGDEEPAASTVATSTSTTSTVPETTSTPPSTANTEPTTTSTTRPAEPSEGILLARDDGIELVTDSGTASVLEGRSVEFALPDLTGGVVFQESGQYEQEWPPDPVPIEWIPSMGADPVVLVDGAGANRLTPVQAAWIDDQPQLLYRRMTVLDEDDQEEEMVMRDLSSGEERVLGWIGGYESSYITVDVGGDSVLVTWLGYGGEGACAGVTNVAKLSEEPVATICDAECCIFGPTPGCGFGVPCPTGPTDSIKTAISPDGARFILATATERTWLLEAVDLASQDTRLVAEIPRTERDWLIRVDYDGSEVLMVFSSTDDSRTVVRIGQTGEIVESFVARSGVFWSVQP